MEPIPKIMAVTGWRWHRDGLFIQTVLGMEASELTRHGIFDLHVRVGDASGVDYHVEQWCQRKGISFEKYSADWKRHDRAAGPMRNLDMLTGARGDKAASDGSFTKADLLVAFPQPGVYLRSPGSGTLGCALKAIELGITVHFPAQRPS